MSDDTPAGANLTDADELIDLLSRRQDILRSLIDAPKERHVLVDHLDASKSTVYKGVTQLRDRGLIELTQEGLQPTLFGIVALRQYDELARITDLGHLLSLLPRNAIDPSALVGAEIVTPDNHAVDRHFTRVETILQDASTIHGFSPAVSPRYVSILHQRIVDEELTAELLFTKEIMTHLHQEYPTAFDDIGTARDASLWQTDTEFPFTLLLVSSSNATEICIELGEEGHTSGLVINDTTESVRWAKSKFDHYKRRSERVST